MRIEKRIQCPYYHPYPKLYKVQGWYNNHLRDKHEVDPWLAMRQLTVYIDVEYLPEVVYVDENDAIRYANMEYYQQFYHQPEPRQSRNNDKKSDKQMEEIIEMIVKQCKIDSSTTSQHDGAESHVSGRGNNAAEMHRGRQSWRNCPTCEDGSFQHPIGAPCPPEAYDPNYRRNIHARRGSRGPNGRNCLGLCDCCKQPGHYIQYCPMLYHVYIGSLAFRTTEDDLGNYMSQAGSIAYTRVPYHRDSDLSKGYGFCGFYGMEDAQWAIRMLDGEYFDGRYIRVSWDNKQR